VYYLTPSETVKECNGQITGIMAYKTGFYGIRAIILIPPKKP